MYLHEFSSTYLPVFSCSTSSSSMWAQHTHDPITMISQLRTCCMQYKSFSTCGFLSFRRTSSNFLFFPAQSPPLFDHDRSPQKHQPSAAPNNTPKSVSMDPKRELQFNSDQSSKSQQSQRRFGPRSGGPEKACRRLPFTPPQEQDDSSPSIAYKENEQHLNAAEFRASAPGIPGLQDGEDADAAMALVFDDVPSDEDPFTSHDGPDTPPIHPERDCVPLAQSMHPPLVGIPMEHLQTGHTPFISMNQGRSYSQSSTPMHIQQPPPPSNTPHKYLTAFSQC
jgi:hypothetical protein